MLHSLGRPKLHTRQSPITSHILYVIYRIVRLRAAQRPVRSSVGDQSCKIPKRNAIVVRVNRLVPVVVAEQTHRVWKGRKNTFNHGEQNVLIFRGPYSYTAQIILNDGLGYIRNVLVFKNVIASGKVSL